MARFTVAMILLALVSVPTGAAQQSREPSPPWFAAHRLFHLCDPSPSGNAFTQCSGADSIVSGDFNGDGRPDVAVIARDVNAVAVLLMTDPGEFGPPTFIPIGTRSRGLATADFTGDGVLDLAVADDPGTVFILRGDGLGGFGVHATITGLGEAVEAKAADFNGDGKPDLAIQRGLFDSGVLLNAGGGSFSRLIVLPGSRGFLAVGNVDGDGKPDVVISNGDEVRLFFGKGDGTFDPPLSLSSGFAAGTVTRPLVADLNDDRLTDLFLTNQQAGSVAYRVNLGNRIFAAPVVISGVGRNPEHAVVANFNGDRRIDIVVINGGEGGNPLGTIRVLNGQDGIPLFRLGDEVITGDRPTTAVVGQFVGRGGLDLLVAVRGFKTRGVALHVGNGRGGFGTAKRFAAGPAPGFVTSAKLVRGSKGDLVLTNYDTGTVTVLLGDGRGNFSPAPWPPINVVGKPRSVAIGDVNRDGKADLAVVSQIPPVEDTVAHTATFFPGYITILLGDGTGRFVPTSGSPIQVGEDPRDIAIADFDRDGTLDLAVTLDASFVAPPLVFGGKGTKLQLLFGNGDGTFSGPTNLDLGVSTLFSVHGLTCCGSSSWPAADPRSVKATDLNGDGSMDLVVVANFSDDLIVFLGDGHGGFASPRAFTLGPVIDSGYNPQSLVVGDLNEDGKLDVATSNVSTLDVAIFFGDGLGGFTLGSQRPFVGDGPGTIVATDFGRRQSSREGESHGRGHEGECTDDEDDDFTPGQGHDKSTGEGHRCPPTPAAHDLAMIVHNFTDVAVLPNDGRGTFEALRYFGGGNGPVGLAVGDFNRDRLPDIAMATQATNDVSILLGNPDGPR